MAHSFRTRRRAPSALRSGVLTGGAQIVVSLAAAGAGALLAQRFGRNAKTDGFLAAYGAYLLLTFAAQAFRLVVVPDLTRAREEGRLGGETEAYGIAILSVAVPACIVVAVLSHPLGDLITGSLPPVSAHIAGRALSVLVPAAFLQLLAALAASALAASDSYGTAALGYASGGLVGLAVFAALSGRSGVVALGWGLAANGAVALAVPLVSLVRRGVVWSPLPGRLGLGGRLRHLLEGAAVPLALQGCYLLALRFSANLGVGRVSTFSYAYIAAATLVGATAFSLGVISSAPLTRRGVDAEAAGQHVVHAAWVSLSLVGAAAGVFAVVGGKIVHFVLGAKYGGQVGRELGHLVAYLSPWMVGWVAFAVAFPLVFVSGRKQTLIPLAAGGFLLCIPLGLGLRALWGLQGIAIAIGLSTLAISSGLLYLISPRALAIAAVGLGRLAIAVGGTAALAFGGLALALSPVAAALLGVLVYALAIAAMRSLGLSDAWAYVRGLH
ncbi:MAG TPA: hypothetical protein VFA30_08980 [Gaiellaceae bacterium]|nr:hypothetical protein [Gaiellaceae bacterium]